MDQALRLVPPTVGIIVRTGSPGICSVWARRCGVPSPDGVREALPRRVREPHEDNGGGRIP